MKNSLLEALSPRQRQLIDHAVSVAADLRVDVHLVGGPLRDLLLGKSLIDLDLALERETEQFAARFAVRCNGELQAYPRFLTFKVSISGLEAIDIATTRREVYEHPGALPVVSPASLRDDMARRDFTVNAIALNLRAEEIIDFFGARADLQERLIRVLHDRSFLDDPTRIYRGIRLATRLGFEIESHTRELMRAALQGNALGTVSRERLWREFLLALAEQDRARVLFEFARYGLVGRRPVEDALLEELTRVDQYVRLLNADAPVAFLALLSAEDFAGAGLSQKQIDSIRAVKHELRGFINEVQGMPERQALARFRDVSLEKMAVAAASDPRLDPLLRRYRDFARLDIGIRGDQLGVPSGPHIGSALEKTRQALFFGEIRPEEAEAFARQAALEYLERKAP